MGAPCDSIVYLLSPSASGEPSVNVFADHESIFFTVAN